MRHRVFRALLSLMVLPLFVACPFQQEDDSQDRELLLLVLSEPMEINGTWSDGFSTHDIQAFRSLVSGFTGHWNSGSSGTVLEFSNSTRTAYTQTGVPAWCTGQGTTFPNCTCFSVGTCFNRNVWTISGGTYYYCQIVYNKPTLDEAKSDTTSADASNPSASGCGGFSWSTLTRQ